MHHDPSDAGVPGTVIVESQAKQTDREHGEKGERYVLRRAERGVAHDDRHVIPPPRDEGKHDPIVQPVDEPDVHERQWRCGDDRAHAARGQ